MLVIVKSLAECPRGISLKGIDRKVIRNRGVGTAGPGFGSTIQI